MQDFCKLDNGHTIPVERLLEHWYIHKEDTRHPWRYWYPESDDVADSDHDFFFISDRWNVCTRWNCAFAYADRWNAFQTQEEAEKELENRKPIVMLYL